MGIFKTILGALEIAAGIALEFVPGGQYLGAMLIAAGVGQVISGVGTLLSGNHQEGFSTTERNPIAAQRVIYGRQRTGGSLVYINEWGKNNQVLDMVIVLAGHPCQLGLPGEYPAPGTTGTPTMPAVYFDRKRVTINSAYVANYQKYGLPRPPGPGSGSSYSPASNFKNPKFNWNISSIVRTNDVVTVVMKTGIPYLAPGDQIAIRDVNNDQTMDGTFDVSNITGVDSNGYPNAFTVLNGGKASSVVNQGQVAPLWADYGNQVYVEFLDGNQLVSQTFVGFEAGSPWKATGPLINPISPGPAGFTISGSDIGGDIEESLTLGLFGNGGDGANISSWNSFCSLAGKTALMVRLIFDGTSSSPSQYFPGGIPQISTFIRGKNDIYDPRTGTYGYSENPALCIADFLNGYAIKDMALRTNPPPTGTFTTLLNPPIFGYGAAYGTEIPLNALTAAANACDLWMPVLGGVGAGISNTGLANGPVATEPMYSLNGQFTMDTRRGEILENMLTACAGRLSVIGGQFFIQPGYWTGGAATPVDLMAIAAGALTFAPVPTIREWYNGIKGTYISPANGWQASDFPYYAQDNLHGYDPFNLIPQFGGDANLQADGGQRRWKDIQLPFTISFAMAQRIAKVDLLRSRQWSGVGTFRCNMAAYQFIPFDVLLATHSFLGWSEKYTEVVNCRLKVDSVTLKSKQKAYLLGVELDLQETDPSIYAWSPEEQLSPQGYQQAVIPHGLLPELFPWPWSPAYQAPLPGDAVYPQGATGLAYFGLEPEYKADAQGNHSLTVAIKGVPPPNILDEEIGLPVITAVGIGGGNIPAGIYAVALSARDNGEETGYGVGPFLNDCVVEVSAGGAIQVTVSIWGPGDAGGDVYMALWNTDEEYTWHRQGTLTTGQTGLTISAFDQSTPGGPDPDFDHFAIVWQEIVHSGPWADTIVAVTANTITFGGDGMTNNQWAEYAISLLAKADAGIDIPVINLPIVSSTASNGDHEFTLTIGPNSAGVQIADLTTLLGVNDLMVMRHRATFTANSFTDPNIANGYYPDGATGVEAGHLAIVLTGADIGDVQSIASVTQDSNGKYTVFNLQGAWATTPSTGDLVVICAPTQADFYGTPLFLTKDTAAGAVTIVQPTVDNLANATWLLIVATCNKSGQHGATQYMAMRDVYFFGGGGTTTVSSDYTVNGTEGIVAANASGGDLIVTMPALSTITNQRLRILKIAADTSVNTVTINLAAGDSVTDGSGTWTTKVLTSPGDFVFFPGI